MSNQTPDQTAKKKTDRFVKLLASAALVVTTAGVLSGCYVERGPYRPYHHSYYRPRTVVVVPVR